MYVVAMCVIAMYIFICVGLLLLNFVSSYLNLNKSIHENCIFCVGVGNDNPGMVARSPFINSMPQLKPIDGPMEVGKTKEQWSPLTIQMPSSTSEVCSYCLYWLLHYILALQGHFQLYLYSCSFC